MVDRQGIPERGVPYQQQAQQPTGQQVPYGAQPLPQGTQPLHEQQPPQGQQIQPQQQPPQDPRQSQYPQQQSQYPQQPPQQSIPPGQPPQQPQASVEQRYLGQTQQLPQQPGQQLQSDQQLAGPQLTNQGTTQQPTAAGGQMPQQGTRARLRQDTVAEILQTDVVTADRETPLTNVVDQMEANDVGSVVVVEDRKPVGILTDRKIALALAEVPDLSDRQADDLLDEEIVVGDEEMSVFDVIDLLGEHSIRRLPIVDESGTLVGIVTLDDILVVLSAKLNAATAIIESQVPQL